MTQAIHAGMDALERASKLPFPEFTAKLVTSTFDAIIAATVHQMEAYSDLVANLSKSLKEFQAEHVTDAQIDQYLTDSYPNGQGGTSVSKDYVFKTVAAVGDKPAIPAYTIYQEIFTNLVDTRLKAYWTEAATKPTITASPEDITDEGKYFTDTQVQAIRNAIGRALATTMMEQLRAMAREGMARIVVDNGEIFSKLTFHVASTDTDVKAKSEYERTSKGAYIKGGAAGGWWGVKAGASYNKLDVKVANESTFSKVTMDAEMIGQVTLRFHTQTFPPITTTPNPE